VEDDFMKVLAEMEPEPVPDWLETIGGLIHRECTFDDLSRLSTIFGRWAVMGPPDMRLKDFDFRQVRDEAMSRYLDTLDEQRIKNLEKRR
jgi:hypothetical protein